eukprot:UN32045
MFEPILNEMQCWIIIAQGNIVKRQKYVNIYKLVDYDFSDKADLDVWNDQFRQKGNLNNMSPDKLCRIRAFVPPKRDFDEDGYWKLCEHLDIDHNTPVVSTQTVLKDDIFALGMSILELCSLMLTMTTYFELYEQNINIIKDNMKKTQRDIYQFDIQ